MEILQTVIATTLAAISLTTVTFESAQAQTQPQISLSNYAAPLSENQKHELMSDIANVEMSLNPQLVRQLFELQPLFGEDVALRTRYRNLVFNKVKDFFYLVMTIHVPVSDENKTDYIDFQLREIFDLLEEHGPAELFAEFVLQIYRHPARLGFEINHRIMELAPRFQNRGTGNVIYCDAFLKTKKRG